MRFSESVNIWTATKDNKPQLTFYLSKTRSGVYSTTPGNNYGSKSGTSMATPHVAAVAAWLISYFPNCAKHQIRNAMLNAVREPPRSDDGWDKLYGHGIVDAGAAYSLLSSAGCVGAGGLSPSDMDLNPSAMSPGGEFQRDIGCTIDAHCYTGPTTDATDVRSCDTDTNTCITVPLVCEGTDVKITVEFVADAYPNESSWTLSQSCGSGFSESVSSLSGGDTVNIHEYCTVDGAFTFTLDDSYGDGLFDPGWYKVKKNGVQMIGEGPAIVFGEVHTNSFGSCGPPATDQVRVAVLELSFRLLGHLSGWDTHTFIRNSRPTIPPRLRQSPSPPILQMWYVLLS